MAWTPLPAPRALTVLQGVVQKYVLAPSDTEATTLATEALNDACHRLNAREWNWSLGTEDVAIVSGTATIVLTNNRAKAIRHLLPQNRDRGRRVIPAGPLPHHRTYGSVYGGSRS